MTLLLYTALYGAVFGLVWSLVGYAFTRGARDFSSVSQVVATRYEVFCEHKFAQQGRQILAQAGIDVGGHGNLRSTPLSPSTPPSGTEQPGPPTVG